MSTFNPKPIDVTLGTETYKLLAFYYAGHVSKGDVDDLFQAYYLGNFYEFDALNKIKVSINGTDGSFFNSEAAFQATKWWKDDAIRNQFEQTKTGDGAFTLSQGLKNADYTYQGLYQEKAMHTVLVQKFGNPDLQQGLLATGDAYLLEHNPRKGRDKGQYWSDDYDGAGQNMLGKVLMNVRAFYKGKPNPCDGCAVAGFSAAVLSALAHKIII
jgi:predicted NAD-dependent protein-ADP-ribosyltransferase YbiA (DUF1768 family)